MQAILEQNKLNKTFVKSTDETFGAKIGLLARLFGCWHKQISRPFTIGSDSYQACLECGARRHFDAKNLKTYGSFHFPPTATLRKN